MHRDVTLKNMLIISLCPPTAVLCDFGKAIEQHEDNNSCIGPIHTLPPEIEVRGFKRYNQKVDVWCLGFVCCQILFQGSKQSGLLREKVNIASLVAITQHLDHYGQQGMLQKQFSQLVKQLLIWDPAKRPTAAQALAHPCMASASSSAPMEPQHPGESATKTPRFDTTPQIGLKSQGPQGGLSRARPSMANWTAYSSPNDTAPLTNPSPRSDHRSSQPVVDQNPPSQR